MKQCNTCKKFKSCKDFYKNKNTRDGLWTECKECNIARSFRWNKEHPDNVKINARRNWAKHRNRRLKQLKECWNKRDFSGLRTLVLERDGYKCTKCGMTRTEHLKKWNTDLNIDHKNRDRKENTMENLQTICLRCHGFKHSKDNSGVGCFKKGSTPWNKTKF